MSSIEEMNNDENDDNVRDNDYISQMSTGRQIKNLWFCGWNHILGFMSLTTVRHYRIINLYQIYLYIHLSERFRAWAPPQAPRIEI